MWMFMEHSGPHWNLLCQISGSKWFLNIYYQFYCPCQEGAVLRWSTRGNTRPRGPRLLGSPLAPHTPLPHTPQSPCRTHRSDTALGSTSDCGSRSSRFLCRYLHQNRTAADISIVGGSLSGGSDGEVIMGFWIMRPTATVSETCTEPLSFPLFSR